MGPGDDMTIEKDKYDTFQEIADLCGYSPPKSVNISSKKRRDAITAFAYHAAEQTAQLAAQAETIREMGVERDRLLKKPIAVKDSLGLYWVWNGEIIRCEGDDTEGGGYWASSFSDAVALLIREGYIDAP